MFRNTVLLSVLLFVSFVLATDEDLNERKKRSPLGVFSIIKFPNDACEGSGNSKNGTCYTQEECDNRGGTSSGSCAGGYGVCCIFTGSCGATYSENCTYFESSSINAGGCAFQICKCNSNIVQLRLDFDQFVITGPSTDTATEIVKTTAGSVFMAGAAPSNLQTQCLTDSFTVTNPNGVAPPTICGINTGDHMYVDASDACNDLTFQFGQTGIGAAIANRQWSIKITQYDCNYSNLAPSGCTQYFFGSNTDVVRTFNYNGNLHLADQNQNICVRRERGYCRICWSATSKEDFVISGTAAAMTIPQTVSLCGGYGVAGATGSKYDVAIIPGAHKLNQASTPTRLQSHFCGQSSNGLYTSKATMDATICSTRQPFAVRFISDHYETDAEVGMTPADKGFQLHYQLNNNCN